MDSTNIPSVQTDNDPSAKKRRLSNEASKHDDDDADIRKEIGTLKAKLTEQADEIERLRTIVRQQGQIPPTSRCDQGTQTTVDELTHLPEVPLTKILTSIPVCERLKSAALVCRRFRTITERPRFNRIVIVNGRLESLSRKKCVSLRCYLARFAPTIESLKITCVTGLSGNIGLHDILPPQMPMLTQLVFSLNNWFGHQALAALAASCPNVTRLSLNPQLPDKRGVKIIRNAWGRQLTHLLLSVVDASTHSILKLYNTLDPNVITSVDMATLMTWSALFDNNPELLVPFAGPALTTLRLDKSIQARDELIECVTQRAPHISTLVLRNTRSLTDKALTYIPRLASLTTLYVWGRSHGDDSNDFTPAAIVGMVKAAAIRGRLKTLVLESIKKLDDDCVRAIVEHQANLTCCGITESPLITLSGHVTLLSGLTNLTVLLVSSENFSTEMLRMRIVVNSLLSLSVLDVSGCFDVDDSDFDVFLTKRASRIGNDRVPDPLNAELVFGENTAEVARVSAPDPVLFVFSEDLWPTGAVVFTGNEAGYNLPLQPASMLTYPMDEFGELPASGRELSFPLCQIETKTELLAAFGVNARDLYAIDPL